MFDQTKQLAQMRREKEEIRLSTEEYDALLLKAARYSLLGEKCISQLRDKIQAWSPGIAEEQLSSIIERLCAEKYIDEERYAVAFVSDKHRFNKWGPIRIAAELKSKGIDKITIDNALREIFPNEWLETAVALLQQQRGRISSAKSSYELRNKLYRWLYAKGYPSATVSKALEKLDLSDDEEEHWE